MVSALVLTAEPLEAVLLPVLPIEFKAWLRAALDEVVDVGVADAGEVAQTPLEGDVVIPAEAAEVGVDDVMGVNIEDELEVDVVGDKVVAMLGSAAVGSVRDDAGVKLVVDVVEPDVVVVDDPAVVIDEEAVVDVAMVDVVVVDVAAAVVGVGADSTAVDAGEHTVNVAAASGAPDTTPRLALVICVPLAEAPEVLT
jgi:hypothetical protein